MTAEEIQADFEMRLVNSMHNAAYEIAFEIESAYESSIDAFYKSYSPNYYDRTYSTYLGSSSYNDYEKCINVGKNGAIVEATTGIKVSSSYIKDSPYKDPTDYVFERSYFYGIHGTIKTGGIMAVSPERLMQLSFEGIKSNLKSYITKYI